MLPALRRFAAGRENVTVLHNERNRGFVKTVNRGLRRTRGHVVLLNTDVELPQGWLERLMQPIFQFETVASVTPFSNCATIFSFPEMGDNALYRNLSVHELDGYFRAVAPRYTLVPTGVGFCMGMSRRALDAVGLLDEELFEKGYGEENDWCQRAIKAGFVNVHAENLFVYHKHGGSFLPEEKRRLIEEHTALLTARHPNYPGDVAAYIERDPLKALRAQLRFRIRSTHSGEKTLLVFSHALGGGAELYLDAQGPRWQAEGYSVLILRYVPGSDSYRLDCRFSDERFAVELADWDAVEALLHDCALDRIVVNELVTYPALFARLSDIGRLAREKGARLLMLIHDYLAVSPSINLVSPQDYLYAREGTGFHCDRFYEADGRAAEFGCPSVAQWRERWERFLLACDEVRCFSESSRQLMAEVYPALHSLTVVPHRVAYMPRVHKERKTTATLNIGVIGAISEEKGLTILEQMAEIIHTEKLPIRIRVLGYTAREPKRRGIVSCTGKFERESLPELVEENEIDVILIPSIWPETFSYTTAESMMMGLPVAVFDLGAPAERVREYERGIVIPEISAEAAIREISRYWQNQTSERNSAKE